MAHDSTKSSKTASDGQKTLLYGLSRYLETRPGSYLSGTFLVLLCIMCMSMPGAYAVETPGPVRDVLSTVNQAEKNAEKSDDSSVSEPSDEPMISISGDGAKTYQDSGKLFLTTVSAQGVPGYPISVWQTAFAYFSPSAIVLPREAVSPIGQSSDEYKQRSDRQMSQAQSNAISQALQFAKNRGIDAENIKIEMKADDIGGPSAGLMYTLGAIDLLTEESLTAGQIIAGTGTMESDGTVGAIGGIRLKMIAAAANKATWFLAPESNCDSVVGHVPQGLRDVSVSTLDEAYEALRAISQGEGESLPHCEVK